MNSYSVLPYLFFSKKFYALDTTLFSRLKQWSLMGNMLESTSSNYQITECISVDEVFTP